MSKAPPVSRVEPGDERESARRLFSAVPAPLVVSDRRGIVLDANDAAADLLAVDPASLAGRSLAVFGFDASELRELLGELGRDAGALGQRELTLAPPGRGGFRATVDARRLDRDGTVGEAAIVWVLNVARRAAVDEELRIATIDLETRVNERTAELARERALLNAVVEQMPAGLVVAEAPSGRIVSSNARASQILRDYVPSAGSVEEYASYPGFRPNGDRVEPHEWPIARSLATGERVPGELYEVERGDGTRGWIEVSSAPVIDASGRIVAAVAVFEDVTERERAERAEREFVTNAAHELLTPLAAITSAIDVLQGGAKDDPDQRDRFLAHAERETQRLARLARALLLLARAQMGLEAPRAAVVAAAPLLEEIAAELPVAPGVDVRVSCPHNLAFVGSRELLLQALANIGTNAAKSTARGSIDFRARREGASLLVVDVVDSGAGIPVAEQGRIFDRFYQAASAGSPEGFGLGLAIARAAVEAIGGTLALRSRPGEGTTVTLVVPGAELLTP